MGTHIQKFNTEAAYTTARSTNYTEPWVSKTILTNGSRIDYNKTEEEKLLSTPLTFEILTNGTIKWVGNGVTIEYSKNGGTWTSITSASSSSAPTISVSTGDSVSFRGENWSHGYGGVDTGQFAVDSAEFNIKGNISSMLIPENFDTYQSTLPGLGFNNFFKNCTTLISAEKLILPAKDLGPLAGTYSSMFEGCTSLIKAPALPATNIGLMCYESMFKNCSSLINAPKLPATTLKDYCYDNMFYNCTSLEKAPDLLATTLAMDCYYNMFFGCTNLNYIKCLATSIEYVDEYDPESTNVCTYSWLSGVSQSGTFVKNANMNDWPTGNNGIPSGWTVVDA